MTPLLLAALLLTALPASAASVLDLSATVQHALQAAGLENGTSLTCAHVQSPLGDGFFGLTDQTSALFQTLVSTPDYGVVPLPTSVLRGVNVDTLEGIRQLAAMQFNLSFTISYVYYKLPAANSSDLSFLLDALSRYDCLVSAVAVTHDRAPFLDFMMPNEAFSFVVMAPVPSGSTGSSSSWTDRILLFLHPFTPGLWGLIVGLVVVSTICIGGFEGAKYVNPEEFSWWLPQARSAPHPGTPPVPESKARRLWKHAKLQADRYGFSAFRAITVLAMGEGIKPNTAAGRIYLAGLALCFLVLSSSYTAQLAALFTAVGQPQGISSISDLLQAGATVCVRDTPEDLAFVRQSYPSLSVFVTDPSEQALAENIQAGNCAAALGADLQLQFFLNTTGGYNCTLQLVGPKLGQGFYAIPWRASNASAPAYASKANALSLLQSYLLDDGTLNNITGDNFPATPSAQCGAAQGSDSMRLDVVDLGGIFLIMGGFATISVVVWSLSRVDKIAPVAQKGLKSIGKIRISRESVKQVTQQVLQHLKRPSRQGGGLRSAAATTASSSLPSSNGGADTGNGTARAAAGGGGPMPLAAVGQVSADGSRLAKSNGESESPAVVAELRISGGGSDEYADMAAAWQDCVAVGWQAPGESEQQQAQAEAHLPPEEQGQEQAQAAEPAGPASTAVGTGVGMGMGMGVGLIRAPAPRSVSRIPPPGGLVISQPVAGWGGAANPWANGTFPPLAPQDHLPA